MNEPIDHHYLPVFYLKRWAGADNRIVRYYRPQIPVVASRISPSNTGYEPFLYTLEGHPSDKQQAIETDFMTPAVDTPAAEVIKILSERKSNSLSLQNKSDWARFLISLLHRNPEAVASIQARLGNLLADSFAQNLDAYAKIRKDFDPPTLTEWVEKHDPHMLMNAGKLMLPKLIDSENVSRVLIRLRWWTMNFSESAISLLTSDRPLVMTDGLAKDRCIVALPIGPKLAFFASRQPELIQEAEARLGITGLAKKLNESVVSQAAKHVYGIDDKHLRFVENRLRH